MHALPKKPARVVMRIELYPVAKDNLNKLCDRLGMTQVTTTSRILEWFAEQNESVQSVILGHFPQNIRAEAARLILKKLEEQKKQP